MNISIRRLFVASALYLVLPICLFLYWWTHPILALAVSALFLFLLVTKTKQVTGSVTIPKKTVLLIGALLTVWTLLSGAGHRGFFDGDFYKHSAILSDLIQYDWPVTYRLRESHQFVHLVYYFAYYLPSALIGKWLGWKAANISLFFWTGTGISFAFAWLMALVEQKKQIIFAFLFPFFSGLDLVGRTIMGKKVVNDSDWEWWGRNWQYSGNTTLFFYVPQHVLAGWICMGILLYCYLKNKKLPLQEVLFASTLLWSPFIFIGCIPFYLWMIYKKKMTVSIPSVLLSVGIVGILGLFFMSNMAISVAETTASGWLWNIEKIIGSFLLVRLSLFYILEFGLFTFLVIRKKSSPLLILAAIILFLVPWYKMGLMNDLAMRASIPALFIISYYWITYLVESKKKTMLFHFSCILFLVGSIYPLVQMGNGIVHFSFGPPRYSLSQLDQPKFRRQYLGSGNSKFFSLFYNGRTNTKTGILSIQK